MPKVKSFLAVILAAAVFFESPMFAAKKDKKAAEKAATRVFADEPDWLYAKPSAYPDSRYMTASGSAHSQDSADNDAFINFAAIFSQIISSNENANRKMAQGKEGQVSKEASWEQNANFRVDSSELIGVEIKARFFDGVKWHSLAVMDKEEASKLYKAAFDANNKEIERLESYTKNNTIDRFANLFIAQDKAVQNKKLLDRLFVINSGLAKSLSSKSPQEIRAQRIEVAKKIPVCLSVKGDKDSMAYSALCQLLNDFGFRLSKSSGERYSLAADFSFEQKLSKDKESWQTFFAVTCSLNDSSTSGSLWSESIKGRAASFSPDDSLDRAKRALEKKVDSDLALSFANFLRGGVKE